MSCSTDLISIDRSLRVQQVLACGDIPECGAGHSSDQCMPVHERRYAGSPHRHAYGPLTEFSATYTETNDSSARAVDGRGTGYKIYRQQ